MYEVLNTFKWKPIPKFQSKLINFEKPQNFSKNPKTKVSKHEMHEWERIRSLPSKEKLEKAWRILEEQVWSEMRVFWERNREVSRERSKKKWFLDRTKSLYRVASKSRQM